MKISKVIEELQELKKECGDLEVIMMSDAEGNDYSELSGFGIEYFYDGEICAEEDIKDLIEEVKEEGTCLEMKDFEKVVTLWRA